MRENFISYLSCPFCGESHFKVEAEQQNIIEIREGYLNCEICQEKFIISQGVVNFLKNPGPVITKQQKGTIQHETAPWGLPFRPREAIKYKKQILSLPDGDNSHFFKEETSFRSIAESAYSFYLGLSMLRLTGKERLLDLGADICWSTNKFAELGCQCVALDINDHLPVSDVYIYENQTYFERIKADMDNLPFVDSSFDAVVNMTSIHHATNLQQTFREISRVLTHHGRVILINEPVRGIFEPKRIGRDIEIKLNLNDQAYTPREYYLAAKRAGLALKFEPAPSPTIPHNLIKRIIKSFFLQHRQVLKLLTKSSLMPKFPSKVIMMAYKQ